MFLILFSFVKKDSFWFKLVRLFKESYFLFRKGSHSLAFRHLFSRLHIQTVSVVFLKKREPVACVLPEGFRIQAFLATDRELCSDWIIEFVGMQEMLNFNRDAICFLLFDPSERVIGIGWGFPKHHFQLLKDWQPKTLYLGNFMIAPLERGKGFYANLLNFILDYYSQREDIDCFVVESEESNLASQKGLLKAGFRKEGILKLRVVLGKKITHLWDKQSLE